MALLGFEGALVLAFAAFLYNMFMAIKLGYSTSKDPKFYNKQWNYLSAGLIAAGSLLTFFWFFQAFTPGLALGGLVGTFILFANNLAVTILAFMKKIKTRLFGKVADTLFTLLALWGFLLLLNRVSVVTSFTMPKFLDWIIVGPSIAYAMFENFMFGPISFFYPMLILVPLAVPIKFVHEKGTIKKQNFKEKPKTNPKESDIKTVKKSEENKKEKQTNNSTRKRKMDVFLEKPKAPEEKSSWESIRSFLDNGIKMFFGVFTILLLVFNFQSFTIIGSYAPYINYSPTVNTRSDFELGVAMHTASFYSSLPPNYLEGFHNELEVLKELNVTLARIDLKYELVLNYTSELQGIINELRNNNIKVMLGTYGYGSEFWQIQSVSFENYTSTIRNEAITIINNLHPDYLLIYPEPYGFSVAYIDPSEKINQNDWIAKINETSNYLHSLSNTTEIGINLSTNAFNEDYWNYLGENTTLFSRIWNETTVDFIGLDFYPFKGTELNISHFLNEATNSTKEFWITEFGISSYIYGERIQAGALAKVLEQALNNPQIKGFIYFCLIDNSYAANSMGLVAETGYKRMAFYKYKEIIAQVRK